MKITHNSIIQKLLLLRLWPFHLLQFFYHLHLKFSIINLFLIQIETLCFAFPTEMKDIKTTHLKLSSWSLDKPNSTSLPGISFSTCFVLIQFNFQKCH